jgi:uncharacterized MnhB-related membrane protein
MEYWILILGTLFFALQSMRSRRTITAALWLAGLSALVSALFYALGGWQVAVIELSVGAGLVTILFVFAINIAGERLGEGKAIVPKALAAGTALLDTLLLGWFLLPTKPALASAPEAPFVDVLWRARGLDVQVQIALIFAGVLGLLGLLAEAKAPLKAPVAEQVAARRQRELEALEATSLKQEKELVP